MFTGLVLGVGRIVTVERREGAAGIRVTVDATGVDGFRVAVGDSVAINGACMTATYVDGAAFAVDVSAASLQCTVGLDRVGEVNLETSLRIGDTLGGHMVAGHVDGVGEVIRLMRLHESSELVVRAPAALARYFAFKGSVAVNGVSLTINGVTDTADGCDLSINIIPHTLAVTTLSMLRPGDRVNLEADLIARYVERAMALGGRGSGSETA